MIIYLTAGFSLFILTVITLVIWYGVLITVGILAVILAGLIFAVAWIVSCAQGIFSERRREGRFG